MAVRNTGNSRRKPAGRARRGKRSRASFGTIFCIFLIVAAVTIFFAFLPSIRKGGTERSQVSTGQPAAQNPQGIELENPIRVPPPQNTRTEPPVAAPSVSVETPPERSPAEDPVPPAEQPVSQPANAAGVSQPPASVPEERPAETRDRTIYFMQEARGGAELLLAKVTRRLAVSDSPLFDALNALLMGPTADEEIRGIINLIPPGTQLFSKPLIRGNTAYIDFNEEFQYNPDGREGLMAQLRQIVWTATEFPNVHDVQILIEGQRVNFLSEGIMIGSPLQR